jgi:hypothetical protein
MKFYKWMVSYAIYATGQEPLTGRDSIGKWMEIKPIVTPKAEQGNLNL